MGRDGTVSASVVGEDNTAVARPMQYMCASVRLPAYLSGRPVQVVGGGQLRGHRVRALRPVTQVAQPACSEVTYATLVASVSSCVFHT